MMYAHLSVWQDVCLCQERRNQIGGKDICASAQTHRSVKSVRNDHITTLFSGSSIVPTFSDVHALVKLSEQCRVLCSRVACLGLAPVICEDWRWARWWRRWGAKSTGCGGGVEERRRSDGALRREICQQLDAALTTGVSIKSRCSSTAVQQGEWNTYHLWCASFFQLGIYCTHSLYLELVQSHLLTISFTHSHTITGFQKVHLSFYTQLKLLDLCHTQGTSVIHVFTEQYRSVTLKCRLLD